MSTKKLTTLSMLTALALIIFIIELRIPDLSSIPGVKLGLANVITVYSVFHFKPTETMMLVGVRVLLGAVFSGNISALMYSLSGAVFCLCGMLIVKKIISEKYIWLCSIIGGILHNIGQIFMAVLVMHSFAVVSYLPVLIISGSLAGLFTGVCAQMVINRKGTNQNIKE